MYGKSKSNSSAVPSDSQAREKLALYVYEYLLHVGARKSAQTFLSEIRWEKNITLGEPPGFLRSWWCVFWGLYCAAPERRETCEHSSEAKAFHDYSAAAAPSPVLGNIPPGDGMPVGPVPPGFFQPFMSPRYPGGPRPPLRIPNQALGVPGSQPLLPSGMDPTRQQGHPNMGGPMQRMTPPRGMVPLGPQSYGGAMRPPLNALRGPGMPGMNMGPGGGRPWPNPTNANSIPYSSASPGNYVGPPGGGGPPVTPIMPSPADSTNSGDNMYILMNAVPPGPNRPNFPMGPGSDGPMGGLGGMESHHMNDSLGSGDMDSISKNSPINMSLSNQPGTPRDNGEMGGNFLNPFQSESYSPHDNECVIHYYLRLMETTVSQPFMEILRKKSHSVQLKESQSHQTNLFISCSLPYFVKKAGPTMIQTTVWSGVLKRPLN
ncbi:LOW QUALITY PROTEIN: single-stranded DNA-binding protein 2-like [Erinaceus europaeus]|uniref:LOW QUALITY PROTEIN: single-stranded DNA-binding protein 2-like n=1 Tax=Erinaceus europaeus TaxID=9365 RepID=A0A1S3A9X9_ERIEU|nr:LOW QUALITY PROTEIN: single-stranded DNA-binding protein 2-like [Erinaceus europaeus]